MKPTRSATARAGTLRTRRGSGDGAHFEAVVVSTAFDGLSRVRTTRLSMRRLRAQREEIMRFDGHATTPNGGAQASSG